MASKFSLHTLEDSWPCPGRCLRSTTEIISVSITMKRVSWRMSLSRWNGVLQYTSPRSSATRIHDSRFLHLWKCKTKTRNITITNRFCMSMLQCCITAWKMTLEKVCNRRMIMKVIPDHQKWPYVWPHITRC